MGEERILFAARQQPADQQHRAQQQTEPARRAVPKHHRPVEEHKNKEPVPRHRQPRRPPRVTRQAARPPSGHIQCPQQRERVIDIDATAPRPANNRAGLRCGRVVRRPMAPGVIKLEGANDVRQQAAATQRPGPARRAQPGSSPVVEEKKRRAADVAAQRQPDGDAR